MSYYGDYSYSESDPWFLSDPIFFISQRQETHANAVAHCKTLGMWIATFHSDSDYEKAKKVLSSAGHRETWIGYSDRFIKSYAWSDYEDKYIINVDDSSCYDFENWRGDEPKIENMGENCAYV